MPSNIARLNAFTSLRRAAGVYPACLFSLVWPAIVPEAASAQVYEEISFIREDGVQHVTYVTTRTRSGTVWKHFPKGMDEAAALRDYLYIFPNAYVYDTQTDPERNRLTFRSNGWGLLNHGTWDGEATEDGRGIVTIDDAGVYTFTNWDGVTKYADQHYGNYFLPQGFQQFARAFVLPSNFEILSYESNREGEWVARGNTVAFFAENTNDVVLTLKYRPRTAGVLENVSATLASAPGVSVENAPSGVTVTLAETLLFPSGSASVSEAGQALLTQVGRALASQDVQVVVAGHTDDRPITGALAQTYASNWELSAARALAVVSHLAANGIPDDRLEGRAHGDTRPLASNDTEEGRSQNRRIELIVQHRGAR
jgi:flagellar motor protein MotB